MDANRISILYKHDNSCEVLWYRKIASKIYNLRIPVSKLSTECPALSCLKIISKSVVQLKNEDMLFLVNDEFKYALIDDYQYITGNNKFDSDKWREIFATYFDYNTIMNFPFDIISALSDIFNLDDISNRYSKGLFMMWFLLYYPIILQAIFYNSLAPSCYDISLQLESDGAMYSQVTTDKIKFVTIIPQNIDKNNVNLTLFKLDWFNTEEKFKHIEDDGVKSYLVWLTICRKYGFDAFVFPNQMEFGMCLSRFDPNIAFQKIIDYHDGKISDFHSEDLNIGVLHKNHFNIESEYEDLLPTDPRRDIRIKITGLEDWGYS